MAEELWRAAVSHILLRILSETGYSVNPCPNPRVPSQTHRADSKPCVLGVKVKGTLSLLH